jgi:hypothetical protein
MRELLETLRAEAEKAFRRMSLAYYQTTRNVDNLKAQIHILEHLKEGVSGPGEALHQGFIMGIKIACFSMIKNLENYRVMLNGVTLVAKWSIDCKHG